MTEYREIIEALERIEKLLEGVAELETRIEKLEARGTDDAAPSASAAAPEQEGP